MKMILSCCLLPSRLWLQLKECPVGSLELDCRWMSTFTTRTTADRCQGESDREKMHFAIHRVALGEALMTVKLKTNAAQQHH
jgi:hypothetical protein